MKINFENYLKEAEDRYNRLKREEDLLSAQSKKNESELWQVVGEIRLLKRLWADSEKPEPEEPKKEA